MSMPFLSPGKFSLFCSLVAHMVVQVANTVVYINNALSRVGPCTTSPTFQRWLVSILPHLEGLLRTTQLNCWSTLCFLPHQPDTFSLKKKKKLQYLKHQQCLEHSRYSKDPCKLQWAKLKKKKKKDKL